VSQHYVRGRTRPGTLTTGFALTGFHVTVACASCHVNNAYNLTSGACVQCHLKDFQGATAPNHVAAGFPQTCDQCHTTTNWGNGTFDHSTTGFTLTGLHATTAAPVPRKRQLQPDERKHRLLDVPHGELHEHHGSESCASGLPDHV